MTRALALVVALALVAGQSGAALHFALVAHTVCEEHGQLEHAELEHGDDAHADAAKVVGSGPMTIAPSDADEHEHDGCGQSAALTASDAGGSRLSSASSIIDDPAGSSLATVATPSGTGLHRLAPKTSPPSPLG